MHFVSGIACCFIVSGEDYFCVSFAVVHTTTKRRATPRPFYESECSKVVNRVVIPRTARPVHTRTNRHTGIHERVLSLCMPCSVALTLGFFSIDFFFMHFLSAKKKSPSEWGGGVTLASRECREQVLESLRRFRYIQPNDDVCAYLVVHVMYVSI